MRQVQVSVDNAQLRAQSRRRVAAQASPHRVATLVTRGVESSEALDVVAEEMRRRWASL